MLYHLTNIFLKLIFPQKSSHTYINKMLKKRPLLCESKFSKSGRHRFYHLQRANGKVVFTILKQSVTGGAGGPVNNRSQPTVMPTGMYYPNDNQVYWLMFKFIIQALPDSYQQGLVTAHCLH